jgi:hypothetical protein
MIADIEMRFDRAKPFVVCSENETCDARVDKRTRTHRARLDCGVNGRAGQPVVRHLCPGGAESEYLGVGGRVAAADRFVGGRGDQDAALANDDGADRHLADLGGAPGFGDCTFHPEFVSFIHSYRKV